MANETDFLAALFGNDTRTHAEREADMEALRAAEAVRVAGVKAELAAARAAAVAAEAAARCPRCAGKGYLPQFSHRKAGECFQCGGTGLFTRF